MGTAGKERRLSLQSMEADGFMGIDGKLSGRFELSTGTPAGSRPSHLLQLPRPQLERSSEFPRHVSESGLPIRPALRLPTNTPTVTQGSARMASIQHLDRRCKRNAFANGWPGRKSR